MSIQPAPLLFLEVPDTVKDSRERKLAKRVSHLQLQVVTAIRTDWCPMLSEYVCQIQFGERLYGVLASWLRVRVAPLPTPTSEQTEADAT